ncbi:MAG TPA: transposase, partial [Chloroflexota bacterium]|nr:transposase [Chloroflexota bacterium]
APPRRRRGRPTVYSDRLFLKALVIMIVRHLAQVHTLLAVLDEPTPEMRRLRALLTEGGRFPARRTWERRLRAVPDRLPAQIGCLGRSLVEALDPWQRCGRAVAIDSTVLAARGGVWHRKDRERRLVRHSSIDTEAHWTKRGWHGWVSGWKLPLVSTAAAVWLPLAADVTPADVADNEAAPALLDELPAQVRFVLGDQHYDAPNVRAACRGAGRLLVTPRRGPYPHTDAGAAVRRVFHALRSRSIENLNEQFKGLFGCHGQVPTRGLRATRRFALGAVFVYQLALLQRFHTGAALRQGLKPFLCAE